MRWRGSGNITQFITRNIRLTHKSFRYIFQINNHKVSRLENKIIEIKVVKFLEIPFLVLAQSMQFMRIAKEKMLSCES